MGVSDLKYELQGIDIYLLDQILKDRYAADDKILDAGCGAGRNLFWLLKNGFNVYAVDAKKEALETLIQKANSLDIEFETAKIKIGDLQSLEFDSDFFDHIICSAVLHFAKSHQHFEKMFAELIRIIKPGGTFFIRMTSNIGIEDKVQEIDSGVYQIPDGSIRYLLTRTMLSLIMKRHRLSFLEPLKTVNVGDERCMSTLMLQKIPDHNSMI
jgi:tellurite methyltransferase